ncbi:chromosome segregation protein SMC [Amphibiibacter pelophylacis]|uniref:Chromosome segregation protein SMC n=1 Tax=Amphibiibacter pelophylacis TaxID=1799477 RepID=A0ACC6P2T0_9BURK
MRLQHIKLSGFKSFADPTTFALPGQLVGVVGPNGCGKSNIMDAVRWVLGESKASELRGESMQDVIFNGSGQRKPAGRASVELVFSNTDGRAGGPWGQYAEIAVRRVLTRDGTSTYSINNQVVRRRDVQDVFLGTGLGPRAYAIIGQGTISRIIESRPQDLRLFLEEAAGVSKYKERRRETEHRLENTRDNLARVQDIEQELTHSLSRLEQQAQVAQQYQSLQDLGLRRLHQLWFLKWRDAAGEEARVRADLAQAELRLQEQSSQHSEAMAQVEALRQQHLDAGDALHAAQGELSQAQLAVSVLEERLRHQADSRQRLHRQREQLAQQQAQWQTRQDDALAQIEALQDEIARGEDEVLTLQARCDEQADSVPALQDAQRQAQDALQAQRQSASAVQQRMQSLSQETRHTQDQLRQWTERGQRLRQARAAQARPDDGQQALLDAELQRATAVEQDARAALQALQQQIDDLGPQRSQAQDTARRDDSQLARLQARLEALQAQQDQAGADGQLQPWLQAQGLDGLAPLWPLLRVAPGWENALAAVLRERLQSRGVSRLELLAGFAGSPPPVRLVFHERESAAVSAETPPAMAQPLAQQIGLAPGADPSQARALQALLADWLAGVGTAPDLAQALAQRHSLAPGQGLVTPQGHWVSRHSVAFYAEGGGADGVLARAQAIADLERELRAQHLLCETGRATLQRLEAQHAQASAALTESRRQQGEAQALLHRLQLERTRWQEQTEAARQREQQWLEDEDDIATRLAELTERQSELEAQFETLDIELAQVQEDEIRLDAAARAASQALEHGQAQWRSLERQSQEARFAWQGLHARQAELQRGLQTAAEQRETQAQALRALEEEISQLQADGQDEALQDALAQRLACEERLADARRRHDDIGHSLRDADGQRLQAEQALEPLRQRIGQLQLEQQAAALGGAQYREQLDAAQVDDAALTQSIDAEQVRLHGLQAEIDRIHREMAALGAVNLAALQELAAARERRDQLVLQLADLGSAIETLEDAIRRIDQETRELLGATFERVNSEFGRLFPGLFGGGQARLVMTGDEILDAGVQVMAQPPGKKNQTIHLLSGGEKALTAIALVFAMFMLNPAPFCLLDEVDAPLDDANTARYARLVAEMSQSTQFLFISHNKIAMEMAEQLVGVTMQEQGVSRVVAVDMAQALDMAPTP